MPARPARVTRARRRDVERDGSRDVTQHALAAYNAGLNNVDTWVARAHASGESLTEETIPFSETREYVRRVLSAQRNYRTMYARQLGLE